MWKNKWIDIIYVSKKVNLNFSCSFRTNINPESEDISFDISTEVPA